MANNLETKEELNWFMVPDKSSELNSQEEKSPSSDVPEETEEDDEIAEDVVQVEVVKSTDDHSDNRYTDTDDLSDGISIISECESIGRLSPHPELRKHLADLNLQFIDVIEPLKEITSSPCDSTSQTHEVTSDHSSDDFYKVEPLRENNNLSPRRDSRQITDTSDCQPTIHNGLRGLFYVGAILAVLAFISKLKYESVVGSNADVLNQKINQLELTNNLMRAEIDILSKQVSYLTSLHENQKYSNSKPKSSNHSKEKKTKVWTGNGNIIEEIEINPKDLKEPFKCDSPTQTEIAGMCIELPRRDETLDKEKLHQDNADWEKKKLDMPAENDNNNNNQGNQHQQKKFDKYDSKKYDSNRENIKKHKHNDSRESRERYRKDRSDEEFNDSGERFKKSKDYKKYDKYSSAEYENAKREADGQWQEKLMQHREDARKNSNKYRHDKNWFIERRDSREEARLSDLYHR